MPFRRRADGKYESPSGRVFTAKQVRMYYATHGFKDEPRKKHTKRRKAPHERRKTSE